ncbi:MAG: hypothetical protein CSA76_01370, partial [Spirochaetales bacterium]
MKKVTVVVADSSRREALKALRKAGLLHVEKTPGRGKAPEDLTARTDYLETALNSLPAHTAPEPDTRADEQTARALAEEILNLREREKEIQTEQLRCAANLDTLAPWGSFEPSELAELAAEGVDVRLLAADAETLKKVTAESNGFFFPVRQDKKTSYGVLVYPDPENVPEDAPEGIVLPQHSEADTRRLMDENTRELSKLSAELDELALKSAPLRGVLARLQQSVEFEEIRSALDADEAVAWFTGYIPADKEAEFKQLAAEEAWGTIISEPEEEDPVPTLVRNKAAVKPIQPVFDLMGIVPGYREADISFWFLAFLSMFVGIIMGDAAYGLIILALTGFFRLKAGKGSPLFQLLGLFGLTTFIWGSITGTWFSSLELVQGTFLQKLIIPAVA